MSEKLGNAQKKKLSQIVVVLFNMCIICQFCSEIIYQDEIHGSIIGQVDEVMSILHTKYLKAKILYDDIQRIEKYPFPAEAIREALLNAIVHKDYTKGVPIQISVYDDRL